MKKQFRLVLMYADGSVRPLDSYPTREKLEMTVRAVARKPGVRYCCEEWTDTQLAQGACSVLKSITMYEV